MSIPNIVVPAYPYEGAIYWLLGEPTIRHPRSAPYYETLYGPTPESLLPKAGALVSLFDKIELASADHALPDAQSCTTGEVYFNPALRLSVSHKDLEWSPEIDNFTKFCIDSRLVESVFKGNPLFQDRERSQRVFLFRLVQQVRLAINSGALLIGDNFFEAVYRKVRPYIKQFLDDTPGSLPEGLSLQINENTLTATGLAFVPTTYDAFCDIRSSTKISDYAVSFRDAIGKAQSSPDFEANLLGLMKDALDNAEVLQHASTGFKTTGSVLNFVGLIPFAGTIASVAGIGDDIAGRVAEAKQHNYEWYSLGSKMQDVALTGLLKRLK